MAVNITSMSRVSISGFGVPGNGDSIAEEISGDGRFIVFHSFATSLDPSYTSSPFGYSQLYLHDTLTGSTRLFTKTTSGSAATTGGVNASVSDDGRLILFTSAANDLTPAGNPSQQELLYLRDMASGTTSKIPLPGGDSYVSDAQISGDGRFATYRQSGIIYRHDLFTRDTDVVSASATGVAPNDLAYDASISHGGRYVAFSSLASNLLDSDGGDSNGAQDIFLRDMATGDLSRVSLTDADGEANNSSLDPVVSDNGRFVAFTSYATNLTAGSFGHTQIYVRDTVAGTTRIVSAGGDGAQGAGDSGKADISADGRYVVFESLSGNLVAGDIDGQSDVFVRDTVAGTTTMLSIGQFGGISNGVASDAHISADGHYATFTSSGNNLVGGDDNNRLDVFRVSLIASDQSDYMIGSDGADIISSLGGNDIIAGGGGADTMTGGGGEDTYIVDTAGDKVVEAAGGGYDTVVAYVSYVLTANSEVELMTANDGLIANPINLTGNAFVQTIRGNSGANILDGKGGADILQGFAGHDTYIVDNAGDKIIEVSGGGSDTVNASVSFTLASSNWVELLQTTLASGSAAIDLTGNNIAQGIIGNNGANKLGGLGGDDLLFGLGGNDTLTGGTGKDTFQFNTQLSSAGNVDAITDFNPVDDTIKLAKSIFAALNVGALSSDAFWKSTAGVAHDTSDRIIYDTDSGALFYDADGNMAGGVGAIKFAVVGINLGLTEADFTVS